MIDPQSRTPGSSRFGASAAPDKPGDYDPTRSSSAGRSPGPSAAPHSANGHATGPAAFEKLLRQFAEFREYGAYLAATKVDSIKLTVKTIGIFAGLGLLGLVAAAGMTIVAVAQILGGIAGGLGELFGDRLWLGNLVTGLLVLGIMAGAIVLVMKKLTGASQSATVAKYEARRKTQRAQFNRDVDDASRGDPTHHAF